MTPVPSDDDALFEDFLYALDRAEDPEAMRREWLERFPG